MTVSRWPLFWWYGLGKQGWQSTTPWDGYSTNLWSCKHSYKGIINLHVHKIFRLSSCSRLPFSMVIMTGWQQRMMLPGLPSNFPVRWRNTRIHGLVGIILISSMLLTLMNIKITICWRFSKSIQSRNCVCKFLWK